MNINETTYKVYHGTNQKFDKFDFNRASQGIIWFTDSPDSIKSGEHGGAGNKIIMTRYITINNPAGWAEYEKYGLQQLEDMGYDGVILPQGEKTDYFVFSNKSIRKSVGDVINEELLGLVKEIVTTGSSIQTYPFAPSDTSDSLYIIDVDDERKNIHVKYQVTFNPEGNSDEKSYSIAFKLRGGDYNDINGFGIQFRILATISKIVKELVAKHQPNVLTFQPVKAAGESGNRRLSLYMQYVKGGAGEEFDAFIIGDNYKVNVEKRKPSFPILNGYQDKDTIQDIITQLSLYRGFYQTDLTSQDPDYAKFSMTDWGGMYVESKSEGRKTTSSVRRFVDWMFNVPDLVYVQGSREAQPYNVPQPTPQAGEVPIQRVSGTQTPTGMVGTFQHFLQTEVYGQPTYDILEPFFESAKSLGDFSELRETATIRLSVARTDTDRERLQEIINAVDRLKNSYTEYSRRYGSSDVNEILNEVEETLLELLN